MASCVSAVAAKYKDWSMATRIIPARGTPQKLGTISRYTKTLMQADNHSKINNGKSAYALRLFYS